MQMPNSVCSCDPQLGRTQLYCSGQSNPLMQPLIGSSTQIFPRHAIFWQWRVIPSDPVEQSASASQCWYLFSRDKRFSYGKSTWGYATTKDSFDIQFVIHDSNATPIDITEWHFVYLRPCRFSWHLLPQHKLSNLHHELPYNIFRPGNQCYFDRSLLTIEQFLIIITILSVMKY